MHIHSRIWHYFGKHHFVRTLTGQALVLLIVGLSLIGSLAGENLTVAFAKSHCSAGDRVHIVKSGDTLGKIAHHYHIDLRKLRSYNHITNPNLIYVHERICIPGNSSHVGNGHHHGKSRGHKPTHPRKTRHVNRSSHPAIGYRNTFPYGQCTWWADQRFYQYHHIYVPWNHGNANAWQWTARAYQYRWRVSTRASQGAIINIQPGRQGAWSFGHVGVVERVLRNGAVIASNMNWGRNPYQVVYVEFRPGPGITFITY